MYTRWFWYVFEGESLGFPLFLFMPKGANWMLYRLIVLSLMVVIMNLSTSLAYGNEWNLAKDKKGIRAYTRVVSNSDHLQFKSEGVVNASIENIVHLMRDVNVMDKWLHTCYEPTIANEVNAFTRLIHMKNETPFIVKDRDLVLIQRMIRISDDIVIIELVGKPDTIAKNNKYVRIPVFQGAWRFTRVGENKTNVEYYGHVDPGGAIPAFITNAILIDTPYESISNLRGQDYSHYDGGLEFLTTIESAELEETKALALK